MDHFHRKSMGYQWSWLFELFHFLNDFTLFVIDIHQTMLISRFPTLFDHFYFHWSAGLVPKLILTSCHINLTERTVVLWTPFFSIPSPARISRLRDVTEGQLCFIVLHCNASSFSPYISKTIFIQISKLSVGQNIKAKESHAHRVHLNLCPMIISTRKKPELSVYRQEERFQDALLRRYPAPWFICWWWVLTTIHLYPSLLLRFRKAGLMVTRRGVPPLSHLCFHHERRKKIITSSAPASE